MSLIKEIQTSDFAKEVKESSLPVLLEFYSPICPPCKRLHAVLEEFAQEMQNLLAIKGMDVTQNMEIASEYGIMATPTMMLFQGGEVKWQYSGFLPKDKIKKQITPFLK